MQITSFPSVEEQVAHQLADIAIQLHKRGLFEPYRRVVKARDSLLIILDGEFDGRRK